MEVCDIRLNHPATHVVCGATGTGKSQYVYNLLLRRNILFNPPPEEVFVFYAQWQNTYDELKKGNIVNHFIEGLPDQITFDGLISSENKSTLIVIDDLFEQFGNTTFDLNKLVKVQSHHKNCSVIILIHRAFGSSTRDLSLNAHYFHQLNSPRDIGQLAELSRQSFGKGSGNFLPACLLNETSRRPFAHLLVNFSPSLKNPVLRVLANIFGENGYPISVYNKTSCGGKMEPYRELFLVDSKTYHVLTDKSSDKVVSQSNITAINGYPNQPNSCCQRQQINTNNQPATTDKHTDINQIPSNNKHSINEEKQSMDKQTSTSTAGLRESVERNNQDVPMDSNFGNKEQTKPQPIDLDRSSTMEYNSGNVIPPLQKLFNKTKHQKPKLGRVIHKPQTNNRALIKAVKGKRNLGEVKSVANHQPTLGPPTTFNWEKIPSQNTKKTVPEAESERVIPVLPPVNKFPVLRKVKRKNISGVYETIGLKRRKKNNVEDVDEDNNQ